MSETMRIDRIRDSEFQELITIGIECGLSPWSANDYIEESRRDDSIMLTVRTDTRVVTVAGFVVGRRIPGLHQGQDAEIYNIAVRPEFRRSGYGRKLMCYFLNECVSYSIQRVWLDVRLGNAGAIEFYRTFGFESVYTRPEFYTAPAEDALVMRAALTDLSAKEHKRFLA